MIQTNKPENTLLGIGEQLPRLSLIGKVRDIDKRIVFCDGNGRTFAAEWSIGVGENFKWSGNRGWNIYKLEYSERGYYLYLPEQFAYIFLGASWAEAATALKVKNLAVDVTIQSRVADALETSVTNQITKVKPNRSNTWTGMTAEILQDMKANSRF